MVFYGGRIHRSWYGKDCCELVQFDGRGPLGIQLARTSSRDVEWREIGGKNLDMTSVAQTRKWKKRRGAW
jgi:hypothetical protein